MPDIIRHKKVIAVEGKDEVEFFRALFRYIEITDIEIYNVRGKEQFKTKLPALVRMPGFSDVEAFAVIRDADKNANAAFQSISGTLRKQHLESPNQMNQFSEGKPKIGIFIMPGNSDEGMLEDLCLKTVQSHLAMKCVDAFSDCVSKLEIPPRNMSKAKAQAFLAAMPEITNSVGIGAHKGY
ncbi:hypothetical protein H8E77_34290 [bacterium]|nr:hypothetical protein [bacterium]